MEKGLDDYPLSRGFGRSLWWLRTRAVGSPLLFVRRLAVLVAWTGSPAPVRSAAAGLGRDEKTKREPPDEHEQAPNRGYPNRRPPDEHE